MRIHLLALVLLVACSYTTVDGVSVRSGSEEQQRDVAYAVTRAEQVWRDPQFWDLVEKRTWIPGPEQNPISGKQVRAALEAHQPLAQRYQIVRFFGKRVYTFIHTSATAESWACAPIQLYRRRVSSRTPLQLIDTIAHENTHVADVDHDCSTKYTDSGYTAFDLPWLVSYGMGDLVACYAATNANAILAATCFEHIVNAEFACRTFDQCCNDFGEPHVPAHILSARRTAVECAPGCPAIRAACG